MSVVPQAIHSNLSRPHPTDSRLLQNLIKSEKSYIDNLASSSGSAYAAASALAAWGTSEAPDIARASQALAEVLASVADADRTHVQALEGYRSALKDVLDREHSIRSVVRDRDILVGRLIKASKKKVSKKDHGLSYDEKNEKVLAAQRELHACEQVLASEEAALVGVKRRTFKEALTMRMKTMGDAGAAMVDAAKEAILLLDEFDTHGPLLQASGGGQYESMYADEGVEHGDYDDHGAEPYEHDGGHNGHAGAANGGAAVGLVPDGHGGFHKNLNDHRDLDPRFSQQFDIASVTPSQSASQVVHNNERNAVPLGQRYSSQFNDVQEQDGTPSDTDSEEDYRRAFIEPRMNLPAPHELGIAADTHDSFIPQTASDRAGMAKSKKASRNSAAQSPAPSLPTKDTLPSVPMPPIPSAPRLDVAQARNFGHIPTAPPAQTRRDDDSSDDEAQPRRSNSTWGPRPGRVSYQGPGRGPANGSEDGINYSVKRSDSIFGKVGKLFKTDLREAPSRERDGWDSRTDRLLQTQEKQRKSLIRRNEPDSSDEEFDQSSLVRHVNTRPLWGRETNSDVGMKGKFLRTPKITPGPLSSRAQRDEDEKLAAIRASVVGNGFGNNAPKPVASGAASVHSTGTKKIKKKKKPATAGSEIGTSATRTVGSAAPPMPTQVIVPGDASAGVRHAAAQPGLSRSSTLQSATGKKKKRASVMSGGAQDGVGSSPLTAFAPFESKYSTASWVGKPASQMTAAEAVAMAGVVPKSPTPAARPQSSSLSPNLEAGGQQSSRPASVKSSASKTGPLKSSLKTPTMSRSASNSSAFSPKKAAGTAAPAQGSSLRHETTPAKQAPPPQPQMAPIPTAPAPVTSTPDVVAAAVAATPVEPAPVKAAAPAAPKQESAPVVAKEQASAPASQPAAAAASAKPVPTLSTDDTIDGTGHLDVAVAQTPTEEGQPLGTPAATASAATQGGIPTKSSMPKLTMPDSEPFRIDLDNLSRAELKRRESAVTDASEPFMTPSAEETYRAFVREDEANPPPKSPEAVKPAASVTRITDRKVSLQPSRVYGVGAPDVSDTSSEEGSATTAQPKADATSSESAARQAALVQANATLADPEHRPDPALVGLSAATPAPPIASAAVLPQQQTAGASHLSATPNNAHSDVSDTIARRKSVRLAPDTKLPPDTPTDDFATPKGNEYGGQDPIGVRTGQTPSALSSRIAPPPAAPARVSKADGPVDTGAGRQRSGWTSRIRDQTAAGADSSDEEEADDDGYSAARKAFGSASKSWSEATGTSGRSKGKAASVRSKASVSSKKGKVSGGGDATAPPQTLPSLFSVSAPPPLSATATATANEAVQAPQAPPAAPSAAPGTGAGGYMVSSDLPSSTTESKPAMPPVPIAPSSAAQQGNMTVPSAPPPPAVESKNKKGFFGKLKKGLR